VIRDQRGSLAKRAKFVLIQEDEPLLCAKVKDKKCIPIGAGPEFHPSATQRIAVVGVHDKGRQFVLSTVEWMELFAVSFRMRDALAKGGPRAVDGRFLEVIEGVPIEMSNRRAQKTRAGWIINLSGRYAQASVENCIIVDEEERESLVSRKVSRNVLVVEAHPAIPDQQAFVFGIAQFLARI
jgi:hypothetical protein